MAAIMNASGLAPATPRRWKALMAITTEIIAVKRSAKIKIGAWFAMPGICSMFQVVECSYQF